MNTGMNGYDLKIIEEGQVPMSAGNLDYTGTVSLIVFLCVLAACVILYAVWFRGHKKRIAELCVMGIDGGVNLNGMEDVSVFHPFRTMRFERELENSVVEGSTKGV